MSDAIEILIGQKNEALDERDRLIAERTEARAGEFRAQERVRELEDLLAPFAGLNRPSESEYEEIYDAVFLEAVEIATKRREGK